MSKIDEQSSNKKKGKCYLTPLNIDAIPRKSTVDLKDPVLNISITRILIFFLNLLMSKVKFSRRLTGPSEISEKSFSSNQKSSSFGCALWVTF